MKIILLKDEKNLGRRGQEKDVNDGYARNYLLPRGLAAEVSDPRARKFLAEISKKQKSEGAEKNKQAGVVHRLGGKILSFTKAASESGSLYASITPDEIAKEAWAKLHLSLDPAKIKINTPVKTLGKHFLEYQAGTAKTDFQVQVEPPKSNTQNQNSK